MRRIGKIPEELYDTDQLLRLNLKNNLSISLRFYLGHAISNKLWKTLEDGVCDRLDVELESGILSSMENTDG